MKIVDSVVKINNKIFSDKQIGIMQDIFVLFTRLWIGWVFLKAGIAKITSWESTLYLFENEYKTPIFSPLMAAYIGTATELILPLFLIVGIFTRFFAISLFVFNIIVVYSYSHELLKNGFYFLSEGALDHQLWGIMLFFIFVIGAKKISLDYWLKVK
jgi:putative oxidoreductase